MIVTFITARQFDELDRIHKSARYFNAGFGLGRNVSRIIKVDGQIYLKLSSIADSVYAGISQIVKNEKVIKEIENLTR